MDIVLVGPGRAGLALSLRLVGAGHRVAGVVARTAEAARSGADLLDSTAVAPDTPLPGADLLLLAVRDDDIGPAARSLADRVGEIPGAVHLSGLASVSVLEPLGGGCDLGSFHPLQTLPDPATGARRLPGAWVAITAASEDFAGTLVSLAESIDTRPFRLADEDKRVYHAAAASAANYPIAALAMAERLFREAGVPFEASRPLVEAVVANAFEMGPDAALTGPIARGDLGTVRAQMSAVEAVDAGLARHFASFGLAVADLAGQGEEMKDVLR